MPTYGPDAISLDELIAACENNLTAATTDIWPEDITFLVDVVISTLLARDLLNENRS